MGIARILLFFFFLLAASCSGGGEKPDRKLTPAEARELVIDHLRARIGDDPMIDRTTYFTVSGLDEIVRKSARVLPSIYIEWREEKVSLREKKTGGEGSAFFQGNWRITIVPDPDSAENGHYRAEAENDKTGWKWTGWVRKTGKVEDIGPFPPFQ